VELCTRELLRMATEPVTAYELAAAKAAMVGRLLRRTETYLPLHDVEAVRYRHEVLRDLERPEVARSVRTFAAEMRRMREYLAQADKLHYQRQQQRWFLEAVDVYCGAVISLTEDLSRLEVGSTGFRALGRYHADYTASAAFDTLAAGTTALKSALDAVRYSVHIDGIASRSPGTAASLTMALRSKPSSRSSDKGT
jgi:hypothetical protein